MPEVLAPYRCWYEEPRRHGHEVLPAERAVIGGKVIIALIVYVWMTARSGKRHQNPTRLVMTYPFVEVWAPFPFSKKCNVPQLKSMPTWTNPALSCKDVRPPALAGHRVLRATAKKNVRTTECCYVHVTFW
jgi:hypothetical protein